MLVTMPRTMRQALSIRAVRNDGPGRLMALLAVLGALMVAVAIVLAVVGHPAALSVAVVGAGVQVGGFVGALWWTLHHPAPRCDRGRP
jgi:hypothetical protein